VRTQPLKPRPRCLLESIEGLDEEVDMIRLSVVDEARRLLTVHAFRQMAMEERVLDVELVDRPSARCSEVQHSADGRRLDHRGEGLMKINPWPLREAAHNLAGLVAFQRAVGMELVLE
jgi:hypothetical protein